MMKDDPRTPFPNAPEYVGSDGGTVSNDTMYTSGGDDKDTRLCRKAVMLMCEAQAYWQDTYDNASEDLEFIYENQWDPQVLAERARQQRPSLTFNYLPNYISIVTGNARSNRYGIKVLKKSGLNHTVSSSRGDTYTDTEVYAGLIRDIEQRSKSFEKYISVLTQAVETGFGHLKICKVRPQDDPFHTELRIERIRDRFSVMWDPYAEMEHKEDAQWCAVSKMMKRSDFEERYGNYSDGVESSALSSFKDGAGGGADFGGFTQWWNRDGDRDAIRVVEFYWKEPVKDRVALQLARPPNMSSSEDESNIMVVWEDESKDILDELQELHGYEVVERKKVDSHKVKVAHLTSFRVLEGPLDWGGSEIPIVGVYGRQIEMDGKTQYTGIIRYAKDAVRASNYWASAATERVALSPNTGPRMTTEQYEGNEKYYDGSAGPQAVQLFNHVEGQEPPIDRRPVDLPAAELQLFSLGNTAIKDTMGIHDANLGRPSNEVSGRAITARKEAGLVSTQNYSDNLASAIARVGEILVDLIPKVYSGRRIQRLVLSDGSDAEVILNQSITDRQTGKNRLIGSLSSGRYSVAVEPGPSYSTQRQEMLAALGDLGKAIPDAITPIMYLLVQTMDLPMADEMARILKTMVPRHMLSERDREDIPEPSPTPEQQIAMLQAQAEQVRAQADAQIAQSKVEEQKLQLEEQRVRLEVAKAQAAGKAVDLQGGLQKTEAEVKNLDAFRGKRAPM